MFIVYNSTLSNSSVVSIAIAAVVKKSHEAIFRFYCLVIVAVQ